MTLRRLRGACTLIVFSASLEGKESLVGREKDNLCL